MATDSSSCRTPSTWSTEEPADSNVVPVTDQWREQQSSPVFDYDDELRFYREHFRSACAIQAGDHVLDVGCGAGQTTRDAARAATDGQVVGVDISERMLEQARRTSLPNTTYLPADAAVHDFPPASFDVCISRFGTMFFADPVAAFANLRRALRPGGRLVLLVWQPRDANEWADAIPSALGGTPSDDSPFTLGDADRTRDLLTAAGFTGLHVTAVREPVYYGSDAETAYANVLRLREPQQLLAALDADAAERARAALRRTLAAHETRDGVLFDASAWIVTGVTPDAGDPDVGSGDGRSTQ
jgi:SAM-dependent methyltransferase